MPWRRRISAGVGPLAVALSLVLSGRVMAEPPQPAALIPPQGSDGDASGPQDAVAVAGAPAPPPDPYSIYAVTFGPGDHPFFKFGHNAILVRNAQTQEEDVYNFGTFDFTSPTLFVDFVKGRFTYWLSVQNWGDTLRSYRRENRSIEVQELDLSPEQKKALAERLEWNARPENRAYLYDYYLDNCSTRVRDAIDVATGGVVKKALLAPGSQTFRQHSLRAIWPHPLYYGLLIVLGPFVDRPLDRWGEAFLPEKLRDGLRTVTLAGPGGERPLVKSERLVFAARRPPVLQEPPRRTVPMLAAGLALGAFALALGRLARGRKAVRVLHAGYVGLFGLVQGFLGCFFLYAWIGTNHVSSHRNENILTCAPFALLLVPLAVGLLLGRARAARWAYLVVALGTGLCALALAGKALPWFPQHNVPVIAFMLPAWAGLLLGLMPPRSAPGP